MAKQRYKRIQAGRLVREVLWTPTFPSDTPKQRAEKSRHSNAARKAVNQRCAWQKLRMMLAANFDGADIHVVLTYADEYLPRNALEARARMKKFIILLRKQYRAMGRELRYIYNTEHIHDGRMHHHLVINHIDGGDEVIRSLWRLGTNIHIGELDEYGYTALAQYLTKEARAGSLSVGARSWVPSLNLKKPDSPPAEWVPENVRLQPPANAYILDREERENEFGRFQFVEYMLPEPPKQQAVRPRHRKKKKE